MAEAPARPRWGFLAAVVAVCVIVDQATKQLAEAYLRGRGLVTLVEDYFELRYARNPGAFFSMGADLDPSVRRVLFVVASLAAATLILRLYRRAKPARRAYRWALALLLAGAFGNLIDRVLWGEVIDFAHMHLRDVLDWATFNVADVCIVAGLGFLVVDLIRPQRNGDSEGDLRDDDGGDVPAEPSAEGST